MGKWQDEIKQEDEEERESKAEKRALTEYMHRHHIPESSREHYEDSARLHELFENQRKVFAEYCREKEQLAEEAKIVAAASKFEKDGYRKVSKNVWVRKSENDGIFGPAMATIENGEEKSLLMVGNNCCTGLYMSPSSHSYEPEIPYMSQAIEENRRPWIDTIAIRNRQQAADRGAEAGRQVIAETKAEREKSAAIGTPEGYGKKHQESLPETHKPLDSDAYRQEREWESRYQQSNASLPPQTVQTPESPGRNMRRSGTSKAPPVAFCYMWRHSNEETRIVGIAPNGSNDKVKPVLEELRKNGYRITEKRQLTHGSFGLAANPAQLPQFRDYFGSKGIQELGKAEFERLWRQSDSL